MDCHQPPGQEAGHFGAWNSYTPHQVLPGGQRGAGGAWARGDGVPRRPRTGGAGRGRRRPTPNTSFIQDFAWSWKEDMSLGTVF